MVTDYMDVLTGTGKFYTCKNCLPWGLCQGFVLLEQAEGFGTCPVPSLEAELLPAELDGHETCLLLYLQNFPLSTAMLQIAINTSGWEPQQSRSAAGCLWARVFCCTNQS